jgi:phosphoribosylanthranilate isomerase
LKIKVCGLTTPADAEACVAAGVDWVGLNFHPASPRYLDLQSAIAVLFAVFGKAEPVGLFVDRPPEQVIEIAEALGLDLIQLHGSEPVEELPQLSAFRVIKAFRLAGPESADAIRTYVDRAEAIGHPLHAILVDAHVPGQHGGTGVTISDELLALIPHHPRLILAGGLTPENVADRVARVRPWMVDVASGVESEPGRKCPERVAAFVSSARRGHSSGTSNA